MDTCSTRDRLSKVVDLVKVDQEIALLLFLALKRVGASYHIGSLVAG